MNMKRKINLKSLSNAPQWKNALSMHQIKIAQIFGCYSLWTQRFNKNSLYHSIVNCTRCTNNQKLRFSLSITLEIGALFEKYKESKILTDMTEHKLNVTIHHFDFNSICRWLIFFIQYHIFSNHFSHATSIVLLLPLHDVWWLWYRSTLMWSTTCRKYVSYASIALNFCT